jgi:hypothetical protein
MGVLLAMPHFTCPCTADAFTYIFHRDAAGLAEVEVLQRWQVLQEGRLAHKPTAVQGQHLRSTPAASCCPNTSTLVHQVMHLV